MPTTQSRLEIEVEKAIHWNSEHGSSTVAELADMTHRNGDYKALVQASERRYFWQLYDLAMELIKRKDEYDTIVVTGPSSSGKTTTALLLRTMLKFLSKDEIGAVDIPGDKFYLPPSDFKARHPDMPMGRDHVSSIDEEWLQKCINELVRDNSTQLPNYSFREEARGPTIPLIKRPNDKLILDSIFGAEPLSAEQKRRTIVVYLEPIYNVSLDDSTVIKESTWRCMLRLLRDVDTRGKSYSNNLHMYEQVLLGAKQSIYPKLEDADYYINTAHPYCLRLISERLKLLEVKAIRGLCQGYGGILSQGEELISASPLRDFLNTILNFAFDGVDWSNVNYIEQVRELKGAPGKIKSGNLDGLRPEQYLQEKILAYIRAVGKGQPNLDMVLRDTKNILDNYQSVIKHTERIQDVVEAFRESSPAPISSVDNEIPRVSIMREFFHGGMYREKYTPASRASFIVDWIEKNRDDGREPENAQRVFGIAS